MEVCTLTSYTDGVSYLPSYPPDTHFRTIIYFHLLQCLPIHGFHNGRKARPISVWDINYDWAEPRHLENNGVGPPPCAAMSLLEIDPPSLVFRDVFLNTAYTTSVCITNPLTAPVEFTLRSSSLRYTVMPNKVNLTGGQSIVVTVRLCLSHYPNYRQGFRGQVDTLHIKSPCFEQNVDVSFFMHNRDASTLASRSRSSSPNVRRADERCSNSSAAGSSGGTGTGGSGGMDSLGELQSQIRAKDRKIGQLEAIIAQLESIHPSLNEIVRNRVEQETVIFEEKSEKVSPDCEARIVSPPPHSPTPQCNLQPKQMEGRRQLITLSPCHSSRR